jgi:hypothetical protein
MQMLGKRFVNKKDYLILFLSIGYALLTIVLSACSTNISIQQGRQDSLDTLLEIKYSLIFIIHGNGDYLYFDNIGNQIEADEKTLTDAIRIAEQNKNAEVFIFHQKPSQNFLFFFPLKDGEFYYYRNGKLIANESYWRDQEKSNLEFEVATYERLHSTNPNKVIRMFLYFGHEIPEFGGEGYDESYSNRTFTIDDLLIGLRGFNSDSSKFDLTILAACFGGTPYTIKKLGNFSRYIIASSENLHLSYLDLHSFEQLDVTLKDDDVYSFANKIARQSFEKLTKSVQTEVSVAVYDVNKTTDYLNAVQNNYDKTLSSLNAMTPNNVTVVEHCDCAEIPAYQISTIDNGVDIYYRPAKFGRSKNKLKHSGWECWKY